MSRFVRPETVTITISQGDRIVLAKRLTAGQEIDQWARTVKVMKAAGESELSPERLIMTKVISYLVNWTLTDDTGRLVPILDQPADVVEAALRRLDGESFREIRDAVNAHETAMLEEVEAQKKILTGSLTSSGSTASAG